jgi:trk system potassium uptake protein
MNLSMIAYIVGAVMEIEAGLMLLPALVGLIYGEKSALSFVICAAAAAVVGAIPILRKPKNSAIYAREGFVATALSWLTLSAVGAVPFCMTGQIPHYINALFEMVSGFTTTGASILHNVEALDHCMLFWRSFSHWIGGMGVLVFMLAILPMAGGQNLHLMRAESPGPTVGKLVPKLRQSAIWLYGIYLLLSIVCFLLLWVGGMDAFSALCLTFGTAGTGGFSILNSGYAEYTLFCKWVTTVFMALFGMNFNFYYLVILKKYKDAVKMEEIRWYLIVFFFASLTILFDLRHAGILGSGAQTVDAFFSVSSVMTTTGYATADFNLWPSYSRTVLVMLMFTGACAGSTSGGIKISRFIIYVKTLARELRRMTHPRSVRHIQIDGKTVENSVLQNTLAYLAVYVFLFSVSLLIISLDNLDLTSNFTAVAATFNNIGPGLGLVGPTGNFDCYSFLSKVVMIFDMLAGRLEIYPLMIFFLPSTWKRHS